MKWRFIYRGLKARYRDQRLEISTLIKHLEPEDTAIDIGANKGSYLWALSKAVSKGKVLAFEPQSKLSDYLKAACTLAGLHNVEVHALGVSDTASIKTLAIPGGQETSPGASFELAVKNREICKTEEVKTITLDEFFANEKTHIGAIKIDVEGHEIAALSGAKKIIAKHQPIIVCESEQRHMTGQTVNDLFQLMKTMGYFGTFAYRGQILSTEDFVPSVHQSEVGERFWDSVDYCNNFIFQFKK
jgi:FkbM family methyltransferase